MLENFKKRIKDRIEKNAIKVPNASYTDSKGKVHTEDIIIKRSNTPLIGDWTRIYPPLDEYGRINWINLLFGGKKNLIKLLLVLGLIGALFLAVSDIFFQLEQLKEACEPFLDIR